MASAPFADGVAGRGALASDHLDCATTASSSRPGCGRGQGLRIAPQSHTYYTPGVKTLTVRLPEALVAEIEAESRARRRSKSDVVRERLAAGARPRSRPIPPAIADLVGSVDGLPADLSRRKKWYLKASGYGRRAR
jgi:hypothetical protein